MLAGISHDLRTPLARIRLEAEISVPDEEARSHIADDIDQLDAIIDKFMDYARPGVTRLEPVPLAAVVEREALAFRDASQIRISIQLSPVSRVLGDPIELGRVFANLFENARRYGRASVSVSDDGEKLLAVRDVLNSAVWVGSTAGDGELRALTSRSFGKLEGSAGVAWMPDGRLAYTSVFNNSYSVWTMRDDGSDAKQLTSTGFMDRFPQVIAGEALGELIDALTTEHQAAQLAAQGAAA